MVTKSYYTLSSNEREKFITFLKEAGREVSQPAHGNMWNDDWQNQTHTLPYLLTHTTRFINKGTYNVVFDGDVVVACSGVYASAFCSDFAISGTRTWINKHYRNKTIAREILATEKSWAIENGFKAVGICFNDYNKNLINVWKRHRAGEKRTARKPRHLFYSGVNELEFPVTIQYTKQWIIYEKLQDDFEFDWKSLEYID